jgi:tripartite-type tricarboxylate transporter receptor subunit TctC
MFRRRFLTSIAFAAVSALPATSVLAQNFPTKPIRIIVPFGAGSTSDVLARLIAQGMSSDLGQSVVVENRPGAGGTMGATEAARAPADGHTLVLGTVASHAVATFMMQGVTYDPIKDFEPLTILANAPGVIAVHSSVPASNMKELIAYLQRNPGTNYSSAGVGTTTHLSGEALKMAAGVTLTHVPYKAVGQAITDLLAGTVKVMFYQLPSLKPYVASHGIKIVGATSAKRLSALPDVQAVSELYPGYDFSAWFGMFAPAHTPKPIVDQLYKSIVKTMATAEYKQLMASQGLEPGGLTPEAFQAFMRTDLLKWKRIISATGTKVQ